MEADTMSLRKGAPQWSLAGDKQLLGMLEKIHQTIVSKCQDTNSKLDAMVDALDNASVDLQNVNNKFMALSNNQFVESRVYDDDVDVAVENVTKQEQSKLPTNEEKAEIINKALQKLELMHEPLEILDSDSSDDEESSMILKPRDVYSHRPLPYIIGSFAWKNKWHAGLVLEESDSDISISKHEEAEEYSESEPETIDAQPTNQHTISSSSSLQSDISKEPQVIQQKPADIAAEISRRLGGPPLKAPTIPQTVPIEVPEPSKMVYRIEKPAPATIFPDEPPPLDNVESEYSDDDIFAELHKKSHQNRPSEYKNDIMQDLFGNSLKDGIVSHTSVEIKPNSTLLENSPLLDDSVQSKLTPVTKEVTPDNEVNSKKPVGGISLFGSNKGAESIGAAILKRNQRKISTSDEENDVIEEKEPEKLIDKTKQPDSKKIIEDLFVKPVKKVDKGIRVKQPNVKLVHNEPAPEQKTNKPTDKIDLFSDNIFDDIDDIFTTNVITKPKIDKNTKSIFDDDDLFSEIVEKPEKSSKKEIKGIFYDDDLFTKNDTQPKASSTIIKTSTDKNKKVNEEAKIVKSIFDDDSDDDLFSDIKVIKAKPKVADQSIETKTSINVISKSAVTQYSEKTNIEENNDILFKNNDIESNTLNVSTDKNTQSEQFQSPSLFDAEDDELFSTTKQNNEIINNTESNSNSRDKNNEMSNESKANNDIGHNFDNKNDFNEPPSSETINIDKNKQNENPVSMSYKDDIFNQTPIRVKSEKSECNVNIGIEKQSKEKDIFQNDLLKDGPKAKAKVVAHKSKAENNKSETKSDEDPFSDIFTDLPPVFEKPNEPKKSKNVNALFDDDSDDESLFFKKDDVVSDEKPDINFDSDRFRIFHDEPPDIDVDFSQKPLKVSNEKNNIFNNNEELNEDKPVEYILPQNLDVISNDIKNNITCNDKAKILEGPKNQEIDILKLLENVKASEQNNDNDNLKNKVSQVETETDKKDLQTNEEIIDSSEEIDTKKPIGKLKPMGFNINVNTLLPGSSPKKSKVNEETDGQSTSTHSNEELNINSPIKDLTIVKSVSFDGDPDSGVLDNKLSKERAKIQVKRRPSTRRARLEAVRKSRVDLESDSTDNSSSFDEPRKIKHDIKKNKSDNINTNLEKDKSKKVIDIETNSTNIEVNSNIIPKKDQNVSKKLEVKSKVVYVLNDEDIFSTPTRTDVNKQKPNPDVLSIVDDDDELFKTTNTKLQSKEEKSNKIDAKNNFKATNTDKNKKTNVNKANQSIFGDSDDDEELFGKKKINKDKKASYNIFDSDTDDDVKLFTNKKKIEKKEIKKGPLFDDESDDDDLFGGKIKQRQTSKREMKKSTQEVVFEHPLSYKGNKC